MKRSKFTVREGLVMLLGVALVLIVMLWLILSGILISPTTHSLVDISGGSHSIYICASRKRPGGICNERA